MFDVSCDLSDSNIDLNMNDNNLLGIIDQIIDVFVDSLIFVRSSKLRNVRCMPAKKCVSDHPLSPTARRVG